MRWFLVALLALLLAGCATPPAPSGGTTTMTTAPDSHQIRGVVLDAGLRPLQANVTLVERNETRSTGADGSFRFEGLPATLFFLRAEARGHLGATLSVPPEQEKVTFTLEPVPGLQAYNETVRFQGRMQCALEAGIISPSCDTLVTFAGQRPVFNSTTTFDLPLGAAWRTVVADVVFDPQAQRALDGLRVTVRGAHDARSLDSYVQYGRFNASSSFTFRIEPDGVYADGVGPVPANLTLLRFDVYPHSLLWHASCTDPAPGPCTLGAGAGIDVSFELYLTTFYVEAAPAGASLR